VADEDLMEIQKTLKQLQLAGASNEEMNQEGQTDKNAVKQIEGEHAALLATRKILEDLLPKTEEQAIKDAVNQPRQDNIRVTFGNYNSGSQIGVNYAPIHGLQVGK